MLFRSLGIRHAALEGYEADDIIATWATAAAQDGVEVMILTGDRDALQLVNDRITVLYPRKGVSDLVQMTPEAVFEKYGVTPQQYPDVAAMRGDSSDNLPGIPGVGEKTAANWLNTYGDLQNLVKHADELKGKVGEAFRTHASQALLNRQLTELVRTVPGLLDWDALHVQPANTARLHELFDALQFRALRPRALRFVGTDTAAAPAAAATLTVSAADPDAARFAAELAESISARRLGEFVQLHGPTNDVPTRLSSADWFLLPSTNEPCSLALLEALAQGMPAIVSRSGGNVDIVQTGSSGLFFESDDPVSLARQLEAIAAGTVQSGSPESLRHGVRRFAASQVALAYRQLYSNRLARARSNPAGN